VTQIWSLKILGVKEGERGKFQKIEWLKKFEMDWSLAKEMG
jgi:hypothetical protein